jgi:hypothetical protein
MWIELYIKNEAAKAAGGSSRKKTQKNEKFNSFTGLERAEKVRCWLFLCRVKATESMTN